MRTYIAGKDNTVKNASYTYSNARSYDVRTSNNIVKFVFASISNRNPYDQTPSSDECRVLYRSISFGSNITTVPEKCCKNFTNLQSVTFKGSYVTALEDESFFSCTSLTSFKIPNSVTHIGKSAFENCISLAGIAFPVKGVTLDSRAFYGSALQSLDVNVSGNSGDSVFASCSSLVTAVLDGQLGEGMFKDCTSLTSIELKGRVQEIPKQCFMGCSSLSQLSFAQMKLVNTVSDYAFANCTKLTSFPLESSSVTYVGSNVFSGTAVQSVTLPATISSSSQINQMFLAGSSVSYLKLNGISSQYINSNIQQFNSKFGSTILDFVLESSDGIMYKSSQDGNEIKPVAGTAYVISVAISDSSYTRLPGMYNDTERFLKMVNAAYADNPSLIIGTKRLNDSNTPDSDGMGTADNLTAAFDAAAALDPTILLFHFSDHGMEREETDDGEVTADGYLCLYKDDAGGKNGKYTYEQLFQQFQRFRNVFALLCCCRANSAKTAFSPGERNTRALFWCAGSPDQDTLMTANKGHNFMTYLVKKFNQSNTWKSQWKAINHVYDEYNPNSDDDTDIIQIRPYQYNYGKFPVDSAMFKIDPNEVNA